MLTDDTHDPFPAIAAAAQARRELAATVQRTWRGRPLLWTYSREARFEFIRLKAAPLTAAQEAALQHRATCLEGTPEHAAATEAAMRLLGGRSTPRLANATYALWLMLHEPEDWNTHPEDAQLRSHIDRWSDAELATATSDDILKMLHVVDATIEDAEATRAIPRPSNAPASPDAGN